MKSLAACSGQRKEHKRKLNTNDGAARYWGTCHNVIDGVPKKFIRQDGTFGVDKTRGWHSRPGNKEAIRNQNRSITKRARQLLKAQLVDMLNE